MYQILEFELILLCQFFKLYYNNNIIQQYNSNQNLI